MSNCGTCDSSGREFCPIHRSVIVSEPLKYKALEEMIHEMEMKLNPNEEICPHCGLVRRGDSSVDNYRVCHTDSPFPDCYRLITVYNEPVGYRRER
ncbi:MAG: hypothetical protein ACREOB_10410 [Thermodesulfobacteriota bacterium]